MQEFLFKENSFDLINSEKYNLSIQISLDGFSFLLYNIETNSPYQIFHVPLNLSGEYGVLKKSEELIHEYGLANKKFNSVTVIVCNNQAKLIPSPFFTEKNFRQLYGYKTRETKGMQIIVSPISVKYHLVSLMNSELYEFFNATFPDCAFVHELYPFIKADSNSIQPDCLMIDCIIRNHYMSVLAVENQEILLLNSYPTRSVDDILFYLASIIKVFSHKKYDIHITGNIDLTSDEYQTITRFVENSKIRSINGILKEKSSLNDKSWQSISPLLTFNGL